MEGRARLGGGAGRRRTGLTITSALSFLPLKGNAGSPPRPVSGAARQAVWPAHGHRWHSHCSMARGVGGGGRRWTVTHRSSHKAGAVAGRW